jgi:hypothetical protein
MLFFAFRIRETKVDKFDLGFFELGHYVCGCHGFPPVFMLQKSGREIATRWPS